MTGLSTGRETSVKRPTYALTCGFAVANETTAPLPEDGAMRITPLSSPACRVPSTYASGPGAALTARDLADRKGST